MGEECEGGEGPWVVFGCCGPFYIVCPGVRHDVARARYMGLCLDEDEVEWSGAPLQGVSYFCRLPAQSRRGDRVKWAPCQSLDALDVC